MDIGGKIKRHREDRRLTQTELSKAIGISRSYLSDVENNRNNPSIRTVENIAKKLGMTLCELLCK